MHCEHAYVRGIDAACDSQGANNVCRRRDICLIGNSILSAIFLCLLLVAISGAILESIAF
jgi:hypothetical protein